MTDASALTREPETEDLNNGAVRVVLDIADPVASLGIVTETVSVEADGSPVTDALAEHIWDELLLDVEEHDIEVWDDE